MNYEVRVISESEIVPKTILDREDATIREALKVVEKYDESHSGEGIIGYFIKKGDSDGSGAA